MATTQNDFSLQQAKILSTKTIAREVKEIVLSNPQKLNFAPGQFASILIEDGKPGICYRSYSVLSDGTGNVQLIVKKVENGRGSTYLHNLKEGDAVEYIFPLGNFSLPSSLGRRLFFVATGTGLVPILSLCENVPANFKGDIFLYFGVRSEADLFYANRLQKLQESRSNLTLIVSLSQPTEVWEGKKGRVTEHLKNKVFDANDQFFICGRRAMIQSVRDLIQKNGASVEQIFYEDFN